MRGNRPHSSVPDGAEQPAPWQRLSSVLVHSSPWFDVCTDDVLRPDGSRGIYQRVVSRGSATVVAINARDEVAMTRQWIFIHDSSQWRLPGGGIEPTDESPIDAAKRELREETGLRAAHWESLGRINCADAITNHVDHLFVATELESGTPSLEPGESDLEVVNIPFSSAVSLAMNGLIPHAGSAHALIMLAARRVGIGKQS